LFVQRVPPTITHNELRDFTATVLSEVCHNVAIEPVLQRLNLLEKFFSMQQQMLRIKLGLDVSAPVFWGSQHQRTLFDVRVFNPTASSHHNNALVSLYRCFEREKQRRYEQRVCEVEMGSFAPLVFSTFEGWAVWLPLFIRYFL